MAYSWVDLTPEIDGPSYEPLTLGRLIEVLAALDLPPDTPVHSGYYSCHGVSLQYKDGEFDQLNINNSE